MTIQLPHFVHQPLESFDSAQKAGESSVAQAKMSELLAIAKQLFDSVVGVTHEEDPEVARLSSLVLHVTARGSVSEIVQRRIEWHRGARHILGDASESIQLAIDVVE